MPHSPVADAVVLRLLETTLCASPDRPVGVVLLDARWTFDEDTTTADGPMPSGDAVDREVERKLAAELAEADVMERPGPGTVAVLRPDLRAPAEAEALGRRLHDVAVGPHLVGDHRVRGHVATATVMGLRGDTPEQLLDYATHALGEAWLLGGDRLVVFDDRDRDLLAPAATPRAMPAPGAGSGTAPRP